MALPKQNNVTNLTVFLEQRNAHQASPLARLKDSPDWKLLSRPVQRSLETAEAQTVAVTQALEEFDAGVEELSVDHHKSVVSSMNRWNALIKGQDATTSEEERAALMNEKGHEFVGLMVAHQDSLNTLQALHKQNNERILERPHYEWVPKTPQENLEEIVTFGESELERRGLPPLTLGESWLNVATLGSVVEKKIRDAERARLLGKPAAQAATDDPGVIDADFTAY